MEKMQDLMDAQIIPADTDYRMFSYDYYGTLPGVDVAFLLDSSAYHTHEDAPHRIRPGTVQVAPLPEGSSRQAELTVTQVLPKRGICSTVCNHCHVTLCSNPPPLSQIMSGVLVSNVPAAFPLEICCTHCDVVPSLLWLSFGLFLRGF